MGIDVGAMLREVSLRLQPQTEELSARLAVFVRERVPALWSHEDLAGLAMQTGEQHLDAMLRLLGHEIDAADVEAPPAAIAFATRLAELGGEIAELLRSYRLAHVAILRLVRGEVASLTSDPELQGAAAAVLTDLSFEYVDRASEQAVAVFQRTRDRRLQRHLLVVSDASRKIGTSLDVQRTAQELAEVGVENLADFVAVDLLDAPPGGDAPIPGEGPLVMHRAAQHSVLQGCPESAVATGGTHGYEQGPGPAEAISSGRAVRYLISSGRVPAWLVRSEAHRRSIDTFGVHSVLVVPLWARGYPLGVAQFVRHRDARAFDDGEVLLAQEISSRAAVHIDHARQYAQQRATALALQETLLPSRLPRHGAVETAARYLPSETTSGVGGDWYDVIPLSGARIALVIGDVVGRGLYASAMMGRLRTAVRTLADIDLMPDELLTHLDDVVTRLQHEENGPYLNELSATCLYAVYDPVSQVCSLASAGHLLPAVVLPVPEAAPTAEGPVRFVDAPVGPPLGFGGLPFETAQFEVPKGTLLVLFTDGLIESRGRDPGRGLAQLRELLRAGAPSPDDLCEKVVRQLMPARPADDVALLVARTRALDADHVATLDLPSDPAVVSSARAFAAEQLTAWSLDELGFATEIIVSELVTNAIRYGHQPIKLRLILQSVLTCEVWDAASTSPHLRRAATFDEGGRGLLLVAQLASGWGTRYTREGKVIWAEQLLPGASRNGNGAQGH
ncbi:SpoIIE family protein phosphatase [Kitasatospora purpeofusca]|uniref:ATP-binding SpoIIE family protein phosphatase n=1 Tax=Kitasatospora purpeofusca TaxID=67352 RepID=UPI003400FC43